MRINNNIMALNTHRQLSINNTNTQKSLEKLSSGYRINRAGDDAAGLAISEKMRGQIRGLSMASKNAQDGISFIQTAEGGLTETHAILQRMRELAVQSANDTNVEVDRGEIQKEIDQLASEITRIANNTEFNTQTLLNGGITNTKFHIGANEGQNIELGINAMDAASLGVARDTFKGTAAGNIASATFDSTVGSKVVDGAALTLQYTEAPATAATVTGTDAAVAITADPSGTLNLKIDGIVVNVTLDKDDDAAAVVGKINTAANTALGTTGEAYAAQDAGTISITSLTKGSSSSVEVVGASDASILTDLKLSAGEVKGQDAGKTVTISNGTSADDQVITITDGAATSLKVSSGNYSGLTINMTEGQTLASLTSGDTVTIGTEAATAATFNAAGEKTADAVAKAGIDVSSQSKASEAITTINKAIESVSAERSKLGAMQNRLEHTIKNLDASAENLSAAESRVRDVDMAKEMMEFTKQNILMQAATAMLAQANMAPQTVLKLLG